MIVSHKAEGISQIFHGPATATQPNALGEGTLPRSTQSVASATSVNQLGDQGER
jgi:hypothetical protein